MQRKTIIDRMEPIGFRTMYCLTSCLRSWETWFRTKEQLFGNRLSLLILCFLLGVFSSACSAQQRKEYQSQSLKFTGYVYSIGEQGDTPLHWAAFYGDENAVLGFIKQGADVNARVSNGNTPLHQAAYRGYESIARVLISHGARVNLRTTDGLTPLDWALRNNHQAVISLLTSYGAKSGKKAGLAKKAKTTGIESLKQVESKRPKRFRVQLVVTRTETDAFKNLTELKKRHDEILGQLIFNIEPVQRGRRLLYRVQAGLLSKSGACQTLHQRSQDCFVVRAKQ